jgi:hypothetical protein
VDSVCLEGEAGDFGGLNLAGEDEGVEGPRNDASRLMKKRTSVFVFDSDHGAKLISFFKKASSFSFNGP